MSDSDGHNTGDHSGHHNNGMMNGTSYPQGPTAVAMSSDHEDDSHSKSNDGDAAGAPAQIEPQTIQSETETPKRSLLTRASRKKVKNMNGKTYEACVAKPDDEDEATMETAPVVVVNGAGTGEGSQPANGEALQVQLEKPAPKAVQEAGAGTVSAAPSMDLSKLVTIDIGASPTSPKPLVFSKTGHHKISNQDSDDDDDDDDETQMNDATDNTSCTAKCSFVFAVLKSNGHLASMILTTISVIALLGCISGKFVAFIVFAACYVIYIIECGINKQWKETILSDAETSHATVKLLNTLRNTPPVLEWKVECYHYETVQIPPSSTRNTIIWVHGKPEYGGPRLQAIGFDIKYFEMDWNAINYISEKENQESICCIVLPDGEDGDGIQKEMTEQLNANLSTTLNGHGDLDEHEEEKVAMHVVDDNDAQLMTTASPHQISSGQMLGSTLDLGLYAEESGPYFVRWHGDMSLLMERLREIQVIKHEKKKVVSLANTRNYDYKEWKDESPKYPDFNRFQITKLNVTKTYDLSNDVTRSDYNEQKQQFIESNNTDEHQSFEETLSILGYQSCLTINKYDTLKGAMHKTPLWYTRCGYWLFSVFFLTLYPRYKGCTMCGRGNWEIVKTISI